MLTEISAKMGKKFDFPVNVHPACASYLRTAIVILTLFKSGRCGNMSISPSKNNGYDMKPQAGDVVSLVDDLLAKAVASGASDLHFEPAGSELLVKFRLDGVLEVVEKLPKAISDNVVARLKVLGGLLTYRNDIPQEGRIDIAGGHERLTDQRLAVFPTIHGQRAVVRLFYRHQELTELERLGFSKHIHTSLQRIAAQNQGVLLLTGPAKTLWRFESKAPRKWRLSRTAR
jgi:type II secretory ATPase GspE/PulE/Tfp pilus assembly ATPase PilB-like protein